MEPAKIIEFPNKNKREEIRELIKAWKVLKEIPIEGQESRAWDMVHFARYSKSAKQLILLFGFDEAINCIDYMAHHFDKEGLDYTIETIVKRSDLFREQMGRKNR